VKHFDKTKVDFLFIYVIDGCKYLIPSENVEAKNVLTLGAKYEKFLV